MLDRSLLVAAFLTLPASAAAQSVLILDDTTSAREPLEAATAAGYDATDTRNIAGFLTEFEARESWDLLVIDVARLSFSPALIDPLTQHVANGGGVVLAHGNVDGNAPLRTFLDVTCSGDPSSFSVVSTPAEGYDVFSYAVPVTGPLEGVSRYPDNGDFCLPNGDGLVLATEGDSDGPPVVITTVDGSVLYNGIVYDALRGNDVDEDGVDDVVALLQNQMAIVLDLQVPALLVYSDGDAPEAERFGTEVGSDVLVAADLTELDAYIADDTYFAAYIAIDDLAAADVGLMDRIDALRASGTPVIFASPDFDAAPAWATYFGISVTDDGASARPVLPGASALAQSFFATPNALAALTVTDDSADDSADAITDTGDLVAVAHFDGPAGPVAVAADPAGGLVVASFTLSELGDLQDDEDTLSESTEFFVNARTFARTVGGGPIALVITDAATTGLDSRVAEAAAAAGYYAITVSDPAVAAASITGDPIGLVAIENGLDGADWLSSAPLIDALETWTSNDGALLFAGVDLDGAPDLAALLEVEVLADRTTSSVIVRDATHLGRLFDLPAATPRELGASSDTLDDYGDAIRALDGGVVARFSDLAPAMLTTRNGRSVVAAFPPLHVGTTDTDFDRQVDILQLLRGALTALVTPQTSLILDDDAGTRPSILGAAARRAGLRSEVMSTTGDFVAAYDAGTFLQVAVDSSATDALVDPDVWSRVQDWANGSLGMVIAFPNFDAHPDAAAFFEFTTGTEPSGPRELVEPFSDRARLFRSPNLVPAPLRVSAAIYADSGDTLEVLDVNREAAKFGYNFGPTATVLAANGTVAINAFAPRELSENDLDLDLLDDRVALFANQMIRTGRVPIPLVDGPYEVAEGENITLDASPSLDPFGEPLTFSWDLDLDGVYDDRVDSPTALFSAVALDGPSIEEVGLRVENASGLAALIRVPVTVTNAPPELRLLGSTTVNQGTPVDLTVDIADAVGETFTVMWDMGDGTILTGDTISHEYDELGVYTVSVTVIDDDGGEATLEEDVTYRNLAPVVTLQPFEELSEGTEATFAVDVSDPGDDPVTVTWDFGNGDSAVGESVLYTFPDDGSFTVRAVAADDNEGERSVSRTVSVANVVPVIESTPSTTVIAGTEYAYDVVATDPGDDPLTFAVVEGPTGMTIDENGSLRWTTGTTGFEPMTIVVSVSDGDGGVATQDWVLSVEFGDRDSGGAPDLCEEAFGFDPDDPADDTLDPDGDGLTVAEECITGRDPTVFSGPDAPVLVSPIDRSTWRQPFLTLVVENAVDPDGDPVRYDFQVFNDDALEDLLAESLDVDEVPTGETSATLVEEFEEDRLYTWRVRAKADDVTGPWSEPGQFIFNQFNQPPGRPTAISPVGYSAESEPTLRVLNAEEVEFEAVTYDFQIYIGETTREDFLVFSIEDVAEGEGGETSVATDLTLEEGRTYTWRARATDVSGGVGPFETAVFQLDASNTPPPAPVPVSPIADTIIEPTSSFALAWENVEDADPEDRISYFGDVARDADFTDIVVPFQADEDQTTAVTQVYIASALEPETTYYWRIAASDGRFTSDFALAEFTTTARFVNSAPSAPRVVAPSAGSTFIEGDLVELIVEGAVDPDGDAMRHEFQLALDAEFRRVVDTYDVYEVAADGTATLAVDDLRPLPYFWRARASDGALNSPWSSPSGFVVDDDAVAIDVGVDIGGDADAGFFDVSGPTRTGPTTGQLGGAGGCATAPAGPLPVTSLALLGLVMVRRRRRA